MSPPTGFRDALYPDLVNHERRISESLDAADQQIEVDRLVLQFLLQIKRFTDALVDDAIVAAPLFTAADVSLNHWRR